MKIDVVDINNKKSGTIELNSLLFGLEPRPDILGVGDGVLKADGEIIYEAKDMKVGLFTPEK